MTTVTINQALHLPYLGIFERMAKSSVFVFLDDVQFIKNDFYNRNKIKTATGPQWITVPVRYHFPWIQNEVTIDFSKNWAEKNWRSIELNYSKAPFFNMYKDSFKECYQKRWNTISDFNIDLTFYLAEKFGISPTFVRSSQMGVDKSMGRSERLLSICQQLGAARYFSGKGGHNYLNEEIFSQNDIEVVYQDFMHPVYPQPYGEFIPNLSGIDLLFNSGPESLNTILNAVSYA
ncbi:MAG: WbqC family protein [Candidatus Wildermuthbacteria bacterium]|nr:WbqC family protein [Candidatus Wildermuthbacteria bacterium]